MMSLIKNLTAKRYFIFLLLLLHFLINILIYLNTTSFDKVPESGALYRVFLNILSGERPMPLSLGFFYTPCYIAFFFTDTLGSLQFFFIFQCLLATIITYIVYKIVIIVSGNKLAGVAAIILLSIYTEFLLLASVLYNQIYEVFFCAIVLWVTLLLFKSKNLLRSLIYIVTICFAVLVSLLFRSTLLPSFFYFFVTALVFLIMRRYVDFFKFFTTSVFLYLLVFNLNPTRVLRQRTSSMDVTSFWGHTMYGGHGGENGFIYQKNEDLYNKRLQEYVKKNKIDTIDKVVIQKFKRYEISRFITKEPHKWVFLQFKKLFYTFGSVPQKDGLIMLMTGNIKMHWILAAAILQIPFVILIFLFVLSMDFRIRTFFDMANYKFFIYLLGLYLMSAICLYGSYMERYRPVVIVLFFIPVIAINHEKIKTLFFPENRKELFIRLSVIVFMIAIWSYQAYEALVLDADRYLKVVQ